MSDDLHKRLVQAIADPGHWTPRGDDYSESIPSWGARAVVIALGLEQVGWVAGPFVHSNGQHNIHLSAKQDLDCEPTYRLRNSNV